MKKLKFNEFAKQTLAKMSRNYANIDDILKALQSKMNTQISVYNEKDSGRSTRSGYIIKIIDAFNDLYISMRLSDHLPVMQNYITHNKGVPSEKDTAHVCMMFMGFKELSNVRPRSAQGNLSVGKDRSMMKVKVNHETYNYYLEEMPLSIPYHIYHFIPEFMTDDDMSLLATAAENWVAGKGDVAFEVPVGLSQNVYYHEHNSSGISSIDCTMRIVKASVNENNIYLVRTKEPVLTFDIGYVTLVSPEGKELTLHSYIDIEKCDEISFQFLCTLINGLEIESASSKKKLSEDVKREIYYDVMEQMSKIVKEELDI